MRVTILLVIIALAGCIDDTAPSVEGEVECVETANHCARSWSYQDTGSRQYALDLTVDFGAANTCNQTAGFYAYSDAPHPIMTTFEIQDGVILPQATYGGLSTFHSEAMPAPEVPEYYTGALVFEDRNLTGEMRFIIIGNELSTAQGPNGEHGIDFNMTCTHAFNFTSARISTDAILWEAGFMGGDATATRINNPIYRWTTSQTNGQAALDAEHDVFFLAANYEQPVTAVGDIRLEGPTEESWTIDGEFTTQYAGTPGTYTLYVNYESEGSPDRLIGILASFTSLSA